MNFQSKKQTNKKRTQSPLFILVEFYLLRNGTDSPTCGSNVTDPCETFPCLLKVFETKYHPPDSPALAVVTDMDVTINGTILVRISVCFGRLGRQMNVT